VISKEKTYKNTFEEQRTKTHGSKTTIGNTNER